MSEPPEEVDPVDLVHRSPPPPDGIADDPTLELPESSLPDAPGGDTTETHEVDVGAVPYDIASEHRADPSVRPLFVLATTLEERFPDLSFHGRTVAGYCALAARALDLDPPKVERLALAGELHDVGKVGVADEVLRKPDSLNAEEWDQIKRHPQIGADLLLSSNLDDIARWVLAHHERPDGDGYPHGAGGDEIPVEARILAVCDAYDAMRADRVYRQGMSHDDAMEELRRCSGGQFDPTVVEAFVAALERLGLGS